MPKQINFDQNLRLDLYLDIWTQLFSFTYKLLQLNCRLNHNFTFIYRVYILIIK